MRVSLTASTLSELMDELRRGHVMYDQTATASLMLKSEELEFIEFQIMLGWMRELGEPGTTLKMILPMAGVKINGGSMERGHYIRFTPDSPTVELLMDEEGEVVVYKSAPIILVCPL